MKKKDVRVGATYEVRVSGQLARVRLDREVRASGGDSNGWSGTNLATNREVRIRTAARLRREVKPDAPVPTGLAVEQHEAAAPVATAVDPTAIPQAVRDSVGRHVERLADAARRLSEARGLDVRFGGAGRYESECHTALGHTEVARSLDQLVDFLQHATKLGLLDAARAFLASLQPPTMDALELSDAAKSWRGNPPPVLELLETGKLYSLRGGHIARCHGAYAYRSPRSAASAVWAFGTVDLPLEDPQNPTAQPVLADEVLHVLTVADAPGLYRRWAEATARGLPTSAETAHRALAELVGDPLPPPTPPPPTPPTNEVPAA